MIGQTVSHYVVLDVLGGGGMGVVYKASDTRLGRLTALKFLSPHLITSEEAKRRLIVEARAASSLDHLNIGTIYEVDETGDGSLFIAMAYYEGNPLSQRIARGDLSLRDAVDIAIQLGAGLAHAHARHIVHRDIKPANVIVTPEGIVKIIDFGVAKFSDDRMTTMGGTVGTLSYMSPEQIQGHAVDHRTDIWSSGVVLYESLAGRQPFCGETMVELAQSILDSPPLRMPQDFKIPRELEAILTGALAKSPSERYQRIDEFVADLQRLKGLDATTSSAARGAGSVSRPADTAAPTLTLASRPAGERRQITVLSCALDNFAALADEADPEELFEFLGGCREICEEVARNYGGRAAQSPDETVTIHFGYPTAYEDNAIRAVRAALDIIARELKSDLFQRARFRIGIHTGQVVIKPGKDDRAASPLIGGNVGAVANRVREMSRAGEIVVTADTQRLVARRYRCEAVGSLRFDGMAAPISLYRILEEKSAAPSTADLTGEMVGRRSQLETLKSLWRRACDGTRQFALIEGEAGIGKSRLAQSLKDDLRFEEKTVFECRCSSHTAGFSMYPIIESLKSFLHFDPSQSNEARSKALTYTLAAHGLSDELDVFLIQSLLHEQADADCPVKLTPQERKSKTLAALMKLFLRAAEHKPLLFVVDDLQWADPTTQEFLSLLIERTGETRLLCVLLFRPDYTPPWNDRRGIQTLSLLRLARQDCEELIAQVTRRKPLPMSLVDRIIATTDGVPLFVEELTKDLLESGQLLEEPSGYRLRGPLPAMSIPMTLQDSLMARLDRLQLAKQVAQLASVIGREFPYEWLQAISPLPEGILSREVRRLVDAGLLLPQGAASPERYAFKHVLVKDVAYQSLLKSTRHEYHQRVAEALTSRFAELTRTQPELPAYHFTEAGMPEPAIRHWHLAGQRAAERSANKEAIAHLDNGIALIRTQPPTPERYALELKLQLEKAGSLRATRGYGASETGRAYSLARELCAQCGDVRQLVLVLNGLYAYHLVRAEHNQAGEAAEELLRLSERLDDVTGAMIAHRALGAVLFHTGRPESAREHLEKSLSLYNPSEHGGLTVLFGADHVETTSSFLSLTLWMLGFPDQALAAQQSNLSHSLRIHHSHSIAQALTYFCLLRTLEMNHYGVHASASRLLQISTEHSYPLMAASARFWLGWAACMEGRLESGVREMEEASQAWAATECVTYRSYIQTLLAKTCIESSAFDSAARLIAEAHQWVDRTNERWAESELFRVEGELMLALPAPQEDKAEACFQKSRRIAIQQQARMWELRSSVSLGRLWLAQSKKEVVLPMLSPIVASFAEGAETPDMRAAQQVLQEAAGRQSQL